MAHGRETTSEYICSSMFSLSFRLQVSKLYGRGLAPSAAYAYQSIGLCYKVQIGLLTDGDEPHPYSSGFGNEINSIGLYPKKMSCMYFILRIAAGNSFNPPNME